MAQAVAEPSPNKEKAPSLGNTDELLSQLAGNEIDRLLAEADASPVEAKPSKTNVDLPAPVEKDAPTEEESLSKQIDEIFVELEKGQTKDAAAKDEPVAKGEEKAAVLEAAGFNAPPAQTNTESAKPAPTKAEGDAQGPVADATPVGDERAELLRAAGFEAADLEDVADEPTPQSEVQKAADLLADVEDEESLPIYLKPLEWINAPLVGASPVLRQMLGKVGIVTLVNALAVLAYVFFFRKH